MFDQQPAPGKVVDIFADTDKPGPGNSAPPLPPPSPMVESHGPSKLLLGGLVLLVLALGGGGYFAYSRMKKGPSTELKELSNVIDAADPRATVNAAAQPQPEPERPAAIPEPVVNAAPAEVPANTNTETPAAEETPTTPEPEPVVAPADTDADGLSDTEEATLGTDPLKADTDGDGLTDREETKIYNTNPNNQDTDGDTFKDGAEVKGGYNPAGPGKLLNIPTTR